MLLFRLLQISCEADGCGMRQEAQASSNGDASMTEQQQMQRAILLSVQEHEHSDAQ